MAKLKFNEMELKIGQNPQPDVDEKRQIEQLAKKLRPLLLPQLRQSVKSLGKDVVDLNNMLISREHKFADDLKKIQEEIKSNKKVDYKEEIEKSEDFVVDKLTALANRMTALEQKESSVIVEPEVKQITVHKNHDNEIKDLNKKIENMIKNKSHKVIEVRQVKSNQKYINIGLIVITTLSLLLHFL